MTYDLTSSHTILIPAILMRCVQGCYLFWLQLCLNVTHFPGRLPWRERLMMQGSEVNPHMAHTYTHTIGYVTIFLPSALLPTLLSIMSYIVTGNVS